MVTWRRPPEHFGDLIKQIPNPEYDKPEYIKDRAANVTDIVYYLLKCIWILAQEIQLLKHKH